MSFEEYSVDISSSNQIILAFWMVETTNTIALYHRTTEAPPKMTIRRDKYNLSWTVNHPAISTKSHPYRRNACSMSQGRMERVEDLIKMKQDEVSERSLVSPPNDLPW